MFYDAIVVHVVVVVVEGKSGEPIIPSFGFVGGLGVAIQVLADETGSVASLAEACGKIVALVAVVALISLPPAVRVVYIVPDAGVVSVLARIMVALEGQHSGLET